MIHESWPWKQRLANDAEMLERWSNKQRSSERRSVLIEQKVFLAAYSMRKLLEDEKLSSAFEEKTIACEVCNLLEGKSIIRHNSHRFDEMYDLNAAVRRTVGVPLPLDTIIHSLLFAEVQNHDRTVLGFYVTSDRRSSKLWYVPLVKFVALMRQVANDYPSSARYVLNAVTGERAEWRGHGDPPAHIQTKMDKILRHRRGGRNRFP